MSIYKNILLAIDLHPACDTAVTQHAVKIAQITQSKLFIVHAIEHINAYGIAQAYPAVINLEDEMVREAKEQLVQFLKKFSIPLEQQFVEIGSPKIVILNKAEQLKCDLIIVGSHGRHGFSLLFGSTASAVMQHASCDVLSIRIHEEKK